MTAVALALVLAACPKGLDERGGACVFLPKAPSALVVYFHGMVPPTTDFRELRVLAAEAKRRGVALVALLGEKGLCSWSKDLKDWLCWPSDRSQLKELPRILARVPAIEGLRPVYAGFSNGGYFTTLIASDSDADALGYVVMHAGHVNGQQFALARKRPVLLLGASKDEYQLPGMKRLATVLDEASWAPRFVVREGTHEVTAEDARALFEFAAGLAP